MEGSLKEQDFNSLENCYSHFPGGLFSLKNHSRSHLLNSSYVQILSLGSDLTLLISPS